MTIKGHRTKAALAMGGILGHLATLPPPFPYIPMGPLGPWAESCTGNDWT